MSQGYSCERGNSIISLVLPSLSPIYRAVIALASVALHNLMACRVFRLLKLGFMEGPNSIKSESHTFIRFASRNSNSASRYSEDNITFHGRGLQSGNGTRSRFQSTLSASDGSIPPSSLSLRDGDHM
ncbi:hypothetical protein QCA50_005089 [Cerrena zonata]|uniref:Uncharacterized protein n=1 Tax=Cerrena zonata TaxID=2478898 RepID=A0AAW0GQ29_9APHY